MSQERAQRIEEVRTALYSKTTVEDPGSFVRDGRLEAKRIVTIELQALGPWSCEVVDQVKAERFSVTFTPSYSATVPERLSGTLDELQARKEPIVVKVEGPSKSEQRAAEDRRQANAKAQRAAEFRGKLKPGDRGLVKHRLSIDEQIKTTSYPRLFEQALVIEVKAPLVQVQLSGPPASVWIEIEALHPLGAPCEPGHDIC